MAVTANYETVMVISLKNGEENVQKIVESEGYYVLFDFESTAEFPAELDRIYKITDGVMRSIIIKKEEE